MGQTWSDMCACACVCVYKGPGATRLGKKCQAWGSWHGNLQIRIKAGLSAELQGRPWKGQTTGGSFQDPQLWVKGEGLDVSRTPTPAPSPGPPWEPALCPCTLPRDSWSSPSSLPCDPFIL